MSTDKGAAAWPAPAGPDSGDPQQKQTQEVPIWNPPASERPVDERHQALHAPLEQCVRLAMPHTALAPNIAAICFQGNVKVAFAHQKERIPWGAVFSYFQDCGRTEAQ